MRIAMNKLLAAAKRMRELLILGTITIPAGTDAREFKKAFDTLTDAIREAELAAKSSVVGESSLLVLFVLIGFILGVLITH